MMEWVKNKYVGGLFGHMQRNKSEELVRKNVCVKLRVL